MEPIVCTNASCTISQTGICLLGNSPESCPHTVEDTLKTLNQTDSSNEVNNEPLKQPVNKPSVPPSASLGYSEVDNSLAQEHGHVIGIIGAPDSGKTACLVSLYLLLSKSKLSGYAFVGSKSLVIFDELSRRARVWNGGPPEQMTQHTRISDGRTTGFLNLKLYRESDQQTFNLFIPDLPGEWSNTLIDNNRTDRLKFLNSADSIWVMVDGNSLSDSATKQSVIHRTSMLLERLSSMLDGKMPCIRLVVTRRDTAAPEEKAVARILDSAKSLGVSIEVCHIASFSSNPDVEPGFGISLLLDQSLTTQCVVSKQCDEESFRTHHSRQILNYTND